MQKSKGKCSTHDHEPTLKEYWEARMLGLTFSMMNDMTHDETTA